MKLLCRHLPVSNIFYSICIFPSHFSLSHFTSNLIRMSSLLVVNFSTSQQVFFNFLSNEKLDDSVTTVVYIAVKYWQYRISDSYHIATTGSAHTTHTILEHLILGYISRAQKVWMWHSVTIFINTMIHTFEISGLEIISDHGMCDMETGPFLT